MSSPQVLKEQVKYLSDLIDTLRQTSTIAEKLKLLEREPLVRGFLESGHPIAAYYPDLSPLEQIVISSIAVIDQAKIIFQMPHGLGDAQSKFAKLLDQLLLIDRFYSDIGGIIGYHYEVIHLLFQKGSEDHEVKDFFKPQGIDLAEDQKVVEAMVIEGIKALPHMGELYPIGGAGDRLDLKDEKTGLPLPTAKLMFLGRSLLTGLIRDLQAREYLYYKLFNKQLMTPIAMMTSEAKKNHYFMDKICEKNEWYHRPKCSFFAFMQPLAPVITIEGNWSLKEPYTLYLKPSGHGVLWKIAQEKGVIKWYKKYNRPKILVRQINNPIAGIDNGLFALIGQGYSHDKAFGFASCHRLVNSAEGVNILKEQQGDEGLEYCISNIEYTDFKMNGIVDEPAEPGSSYSKYPSNTNILFADLVEVEKALSKCTIPGKLINMKNEVPYLNEKGEASEIKGGRLESTMQNIADYITDQIDGPINPEKPLDLKTFLTYNAREKTISVTKKSYKEGESLNETPEGCYFCLMQNNLKLLKDYCHIDVPEPDNENSFIQNGPNLHFIYHPALGPLYSIIQQKIRGGKIAKGSELQLESTKIDFENVELNGSLIIDCEEPLGHLDEENLLHYSKKAGGCTLWNVKVENRGINRGKTKCYWKNQIERHEELSIHLSQNSEFFAKDVTFIGNFQIKVPANTLMIAKMDGDKVVFETKEIQEPTWSFDYSLSPDNKVKIKRVDRA